MSRAAGSKHFNVTMPKWGTLFIEGLRVRLGEHHSSATILRAMVLDYLTAACFSDDTARVKAAVAHYGATRGRRKKHELEEEQRLEEMAFAFLQGIGIQLPDEVVCLGTLPRSAAKGRPPRTSPEDEDEVSSEDEDEDEVSSEDPEDWF